MEAYWPGRGVVNLQAALDGEGSVERSWAWNVDYILLLRLSLQGNDPGRSTPRSTASVNRSFGGWRHDGTQDGCLASR